jgi:hypothetical protein
MLKQRHASTLLPLAPALMLAAGLLFSCVGGPKTVPQAGAASGAAAVQTPEQKQVASLEKADSLLQSGNVEAAVASLSQLAAREPSSAELRLL